MNARVLVGLLLGLATQSSAIAQEWDWEFTPYLWSAGIDGDVTLGNLQDNIDVDFSDIVDVLSGAALFHVEAHRDQHGFFGDLAYLDLEPDDVATVAGSAQVEFETTVIELGYVRNVSGLGWEFGLRYWDFDLSINPTLVAEVARGQDWVDGFVGFRTEQMISSNWSFEPRFNIGAGGSDITWGLDLNFSRRLNSGNRLAIGGKMLSFDYDDQNVQGIPYAADVLFMGLQIGYVFD